MMVVCVIVFPSGKVVNCASEKQLLVYVLVICDPSQPTICVRVDVIVLEKAVLVAVYKVLVVTPVAICEQA